MSSIPQGAQSTSHREWTWSEASSSMGAACPCEFVQEPRGGRGYLASETSLPSLMICPLKDSAESERSCASGTPQTGPRGLQVEGPLVNSGGGVPLRPQTTPPTILWRPERKKQSLDSVLRGGFLEDCPKEGCRDGTCLHRSFCVELSLLPTCSGWITCFRASLGQSCQGENNDLWHLPALLEVTRSQRASPRGKGVGHRTSKF